MQAASAACSVLAGHLPFRSGRPCALPLSHDGRRWPHAEGGRREQTWDATEFCAVESCGSSTPCRIGSTRGLEVIDRIADGEKRDANVALLRDLSETLTHGSLCAMG